MTQVRTTVMPCADEEMELREFVPSDVVNGKVDYSCTRCGWLQESAAGGAAELCRLARWHSQEAYDRYAAIAREGGFEVPDVPNNRDWL